MISFIIVCASGLLIVPKSSACGCRSSNSLSPPMQAASAPRCLDGIARCVCSADRRPSLPGPSRQLVRRKDVPRSWGHH